MKLFNSNTIIAMAALATSVVAVFIAWDEARLLRRSQAAAFMPILDGSLSFNLDQDDIFIRLSAENVGHGVASIDSAELLVAGQSVDDWLVFQEKLLTPELAAAADLSWSSTQRFLPAGERVDLFTLRWREDPKIREAMTTFVTEQALDRYQDASFPLCYCSLFDACWIKDLGGSERAEPVSNCPSTGDPTEKLWMTYAATKQSAGAE